MTLSGWEDEEHCSGEGSVGSGDARSGLPGRPRLFVWLCLPLPVAACPGTAESGGQPGTGSQVLIQAAAPPSPHQGQEGPWLCPLSPSKAPVTVTP